MPRENKKRGRRGEEKKRKLEDFEEESAQQKRQKIDEDAGPVDSINEAMAVEQDYMPLATGLEDQAYGGEAAYEAADKPFFGMLDEEEQEYFKNADDMLELNNFAEVEERQLFLANVWREADGKELKIANSQSCSRLMERLISLSSPSQLKSLFQKFSGNFMHLIQHRFASHCCEKLFIRAAPFVTQEMTHPPAPDTLQEGEVYVSMENLFLYALGELEDSLGFLMTDRFASHTLRVLLLILAGEPLSSSKSLLQSKKKENVAVNGEAAAEAQDEKRAVPDSFTEALHKLLTNTVAGLDTTSLRALATHQLGNPTLQLLVKLELTHFGKQKARDNTSIIRTLLPDEHITPECDSAIFINGLVFDPIGSHLVETIVEYAPGKMFKSLYKGLLKERMASLARNEIAGYVVSKVLDRLSKDDLLDAHEMIAPTIPSLVERNRFAVVKTLIARCAVRDINTQTIAIKLSEAYPSSNGGFDIERLLKYTEDGAAATNGHTSNETGGNGAKLQGNLLAQQMVMVPGPLSSLVFEALSSLSPSILQKMASDHIISRTMQAAMSSSNASIIARRKLIQQYYGSIGEMALDRAASRVVDAIWEGTHGLAFIRERIAEELAENEAALRDNPCGRAVWKNWKMDLYKRRRGDWVKQSKNKASNDGFQSFSEFEANKGGRGRPTGRQEGGNGGKSALQLARERHAAKKAKKGGAGAGAGPGTGSNSGAVSGRA